MVNRDGGFKMKKRLKELWLRDMKREKERARERGGGGGGVCWI